jgi:hypothetical protein
MACVKVPATAPGSKGVPRIAGFLSLLSGPSKSFSGPQFPQLTRVALGGVARYKGSGVRTAPRNSILLWLSLFP